MSNRQYITTTLPYVNANPHIGFAMEIIRADIFARFQKQSGCDVFFNTGTDEHGQKIYAKARERGVTTQDHVDEFSQNFKELLPKLDISDDIKFIRTTDEYHKEAAQEFWRKCKENGFIYKKKYSGKYCAGCEMFINDRDLIDGFCPDHPGKELEWIEEENYFFALSKFEDKLRELFESKEDFVIPQSRHNEMLAQINAGLEDFSISRLSNKMPWGIAVPDDDEHVMYVWFDALVNYISTLDWPDNNDNFEKFWINGNPVQFCGKDNTQHQAIRWQAMLMSVDLPNSAHVVVNGFITSGGQKMSKSLGNVIDPVEVVDEYSADVLRYFVARELHPFEDSDVTIEKINESYTANLVNGLGNLTSRILKMAESYCDEKIKIEEVQIDSDFAQNMEDFNFQKAIDIVWDKIGKMDEKIAKEKPFVLVKEDRSAAARIVVDLVRDLSWVAQHLKFFMPTAAALIQDAINNQKKPDRPLFERKDLSNKNV